MRVFVAIDIPEKVSAEIETLQSALAVGRRVALENLHLTMSFLGEQSEHAVQDAHEALSTIGRAGFGLRLSGVGSFGSRSPNLVYADVEKNTDLIDLARRIRRTLRSVGLEFQKQRFRPHVTIARLPKFVSASDLVHVRGFLTENAVFRGTSFRVNSFELYQSILKPSGAYHERLASYPLAEC